MSITNNYVDYPVSGRFGSGMYTYKCVLDTSDTGVVKIEIFADTVEDAMAIVECNFGTIVNYSYLNDYLISLILAPYSDGTCMLYVN